jgi:hypothetical protein
VKCMISQIDTETCKTYSDYLCIEQPNLVQIQKFGIIKELNKVQAKILPFFK